ncbi:MAG: polysaccharide biosynthesis tyrosine autokinase [Candidatus Dormibacteria bacterium]
MSLKAVRQYLRALRRRIFVVIILAALFAGFSAYTTLKTTPLYTASALMLISPSTAYLGADLITQKLVKTYSEMMTKEPLLQAVIADANLDVDPGYLASKIVVNTVPGTLFLTIDVTDASPTLAQEVANFVAQDIVQPDKVAWNDSTKIYLKLFLQTNNLVVVEPASTPVAPIGSGRGRNVLVAGGVGLLLGVGLAFLLEALDSGIKKPEDVEAQVELPVMGRVPARPLSPSVIAAGDGEGGLGDKTLEGLAAMARRILLRSQDKQVKTILVTSPQQGEGKSTAAAYLALGFAREGNRTVLVDGSIENPTLHRLFGLENTAGLMDGLKFGTPPRNLLRETGIPNLWLITTGPLPANPSGMLLPERVSNFVAGMAQLCDVAIIDTASLATGSEVEELARASDRVLLVVRALKTSKELASRARDALVDRGLDAFGALFTSFEEKLEKGGTKAA